MKLKIGIINSEFFRGDLGGYGGYGSLTKYISEKYNSQQESPFEFIVFLAHPHTKDKLIAYNTPVYPLKKTIPPIKFVEYRRRLNRIDVDLLLSIELSHGYLYTLLQKTDKPLIIWLQDPRSREEWEKIATSKYIFNKEAKGRNINLIVASYRITYKIVKRFCSNLTFATQARFLKYRAVRKYGTEDALKARFLPNPINIPKKVRFADKASQPTILFLGRLDPIKRPWIFFEIAKQMPEYLFLVAGKPHDFEYMRSRIEPYKKVKNLKFLGVVTGKQKDEILRKSWILVNTSLHEALPVSFLEAFAYKIPVISSQNPDNLTSTFGYFVGEVLGDGYDSIEKFTRAIRILIEDEKERKRIGQKAHKYVKKYHNFKMFERTLIKIYDSLL